MNENKLYKKIVFYFCLSSFLLCILLLCFIHQSYLYDTVIVIFVVMIIFLNLSILYMILFKYLKNHIQKFIYQNFSYLQKNIQKLIKGKDLKLLDFHHQKIEILNQMFYKYKNTSHTNKPIIDLSHQDIAMFTCLHRNQTTHFSMNMQSLLGLDFQQWQTLRRSPDQFQNYIINLQKQMNDDHMVEVNEKFLSIYIYPLEHEFLGIIIDRTQDMIKKTYLLKQLKEIESKSQIDSLTQIYNRKGFELHVQNCLCQNHSKGMLVALDVDNFKCINDNCGHQEGDKVLQLIAQFLTENSSSQDIIGRIGGDEFLIFIPYTLSMVSLEKKLQYFIEAFRKTLSHYYQDYHVSISMGVAFVSSSINDYPTLYHYADSALYHAKKTGKNKYFIHHDNI